MMMRDNYNKYTNNGSNEIAKLPLTQSISDAMRYER